jgi:hypothetical protein
MFKFGKLNTNYFSSHGIDVLEILNDNVNNFRKIEHIDLHNNNKMESRIVNDKMESKIINDKKNYQIIKSHDIVYWDGKFVNVSSGNIINNCNQVSRIASDGGIFFINHIDFSEGVPEFRAKNGMYFKYVKGMLYLVDDGCNDNNYDIKSDPTIEKAVEIFKKGIIKNKYGWGTNIMDIVLALRDGILSDVIESVIKGIPTYDKHGMSVHSSNFLNKCREAMESYNERLKYEKEEKEEQISKQQWEKEKQEFILLTKQKRREEEERKKKQEEEDRKLKYETYLKAKAGYERAQKNRNIAIGIINQNRRYKNKNYN